MAQRGYLSNLSSDAPIYRRLHISSDPSFIKIRYSPLVQGCISLMRSTFTKADRFTRAGPRSRTERISVPF
jgi:hypothetical protein